MAVSKHFSFWGRSLSLVFLLSSASVPVLGANPECFPAMDNKKSQYLVAYGPLLYQTAREKRLDKGSTEVPVWVHGYSRGWMARDKARSPNRTLLGASKESGKEFNAVILSASDSQIKSLDREAVQYCRTRISEQHLRPMAGGTLPKSGEYWMYTVRKNLKAKPAGKFAIQQSDVDIFVTGCLQQAETFKLKSFSEQCIDTTSGWSVHWNDDRDRPSGGKLVQNRRKQIDLLLERLEGNLYEKVRAQ